MSKKSECGQRAVLIQDLLFMSLPHRCNMQSRRAVSCKLVESVADSMLFFASDSVAIRTVIPGVWCLENLPLRRSGCLPRETSISKLMEQLNISGISRAEPCVYLVLVRSKATRSIGALKSRLDLPSCFQHPFHPAQAVENAT
jgi:hypothetical protein